MGRAKREVERVVPAQEVVEEGELRRVVRLDCNRGTAKCLTITCQVSTNWTSMLHHPHHCLLVRMTITYIPPGVRREGKRQFHSGGESSVVEQHVGGGLHLSGQSGNRLQGQCHR